MSRRFKAARERVFAAWTTADILKQWWGPETHTTTHVELDPQEGGPYRIVMQPHAGFPVTIYGIFEKVIPPRQLIYTWQVEGMDIEGIVTRVTVDFIEHGPHTEVAITHAHIPEPAIRDNHQYGWQQSLDGLTALLHR